jgi:hypothetical protein
VFEIGAQVVTRVVEAVEDVIISSWSMPTSMPSVRLGELTEVFDSERLPDEMSNTHFRHLKTPRLPSTINSPSTQRHVVLRPAAEPSSLSGYAATLKRFVRPGRPRA